MPGGGACHVHVKQRDQVRGNFRDRGYDAEWERVRKRQLHREPYCADCRDEGLLVLATDVDHVDGSGPQGNNDPSNLRSLCHSHHSRKTATRDGGFGNAPKPVTVPF